MRPLYRHTQTGYLLIFVTIPLAVAMVVAGRLTGTWVLQLIPIVALAPTIWVFSSLTVEVTPTELIWFFGPGVLRKSIPRADIVKATPVRNKWWHGWGIHLTPRGWLYNVSGLEAVEIELATGKFLRIGSDESDRLAHALE